MDIGVSGRMRSNLANFGLPQQPTDNLCPLRAFLLVVLLRNDHLNYQQRRSRGDSRPSNMSDFISWYPCPENNGSSWGEKEERKSHAMAAVFFTTNSLAFLQKDRRFCVFSNKDNISILQEIHTKRVQKVYAQKGNSAGRDHPFPPHCSRECALKTTWLLKWKKSTARS